MRVLFRRTALATWASLLVWRGLVHPARAGEVRCEGGDDAEACSLTEDWTALLQHPRPAALGNDSSPADVGKVEPKGSQAPSPAQPARQVPSLPLEAAVAVSGAHPGASYASADTVRSLAAEVLDDQDQSRAGAGQSPWSPLPPHPGHLRPQPHLALAWTRWSVVAPLALAAALLLLLTELVPNRCSWLQAPYVVALLSSIAIVVLNTYVQLGLVVARVTFFEHFVARCLFCALFGGSLAMQLPKTTVLWPKDLDLRCKVLLRGFLGDFTIIFACILPKCTPAALLALLIATQSVWASVLCYFALGERLCWQELSCMAAGVAAVTLMIFSQQAKDIAGSFEICWGVVLACSASCAWAASGLINRSVRGKVHHLALVIAMGCLGLLLALPVAWAFPEVATVSMATARGEADAAVFLISGIYGLAFAVYMNKAAMLEKAGPVILFMNGSAMMLQLMADAFFIGDHYGRLGWVSFTILFGYLVATFFVGARDEVSERRGPAQVKLDGYPPLPLAAAAG